MLKKIEAVLNEQIRPVLRDDGGDVEILEFSEEDGLLRLRLRGQCSTCPRAQHTSDHVIKKLLTEETDVRNIIIETGLSEELLDLAKKILNGGKEC